ncbi:MAG: HD domain-containing phosphohydrolase [Pseudomonadota bacterium]
MSEMKGFEMKKTPFASLRVRLLLLMLIIILPILGLIVYDDIIDENQKRLSVLNESLRQAQNASLIYSQIIAEARQTLFVLSQLPQFQQQDPEVCSKILTSVLEKSENFSNLAATKLNGDVFASAIVSAKPINLADRKWFQRLVQTRSFVIGEYLIGRITSKPNIPFGYPILNSTGQLRTILVVVLDLDRIGKKMAAIQLPEGANLTVIDSNATIIFRFPDPEKFIGRDMPEKDIVKTILTKKEGVQEGIGLDGGRRLYGFTMIGSGVEAIYVSVSMPEQVAFAEVRRQTVREFVGVGLVGVLALLGAWLFGGILIVSPANRLLNFTKRVADGDLTVRTGQSNVSGELGLLASNFDRMTESLHCREQERKRSEKQLKETLESLRRAVGATIQVMVSAVEVRDPYTSGHQIRSADLARAIATEMGLPQDKIDAIRMAGSIHDIGKIAVPAEILSKPTKLRDFEFSMIKFHAQAGYDILKGIEFPWPLAEIVYQHHERMDGSGYPRNLKGEEICIEARILAVADVVEAMASYRPYRPGLGIDAALKEIENNSGIFYDKTVADACLRLFREKGFQLAGT